MPSKKLQIVDSIVQKLDWNQTDETQKDFIKNKPDENKALIVIAETELAVPVAAADNSIFTDNNGVLYTL